MSEFTINVVVTTGGTIDADLSNIQTVDVVVEQGGQISAEVTGGGLGPQGEQGEQGIQGETGATGATGAGVPNGGTLGQVLAKLSGTDQDTAWHTPVKADVGLGNADNTSDANKPVSTATQTALDAKQPLDSDLTSIAGLSPSNDDVIQRKVGAWTNRTPAQLKTDLSLTKSDVGLGSADNTSDANKPVSTATQTALDAKVTGPASVTDDLPAIFDGTTGKLIKSKTYAAFKTLLALVKGDVGLGNVDNTADSAKSVASAAILTTARNIDGQSFDGSGNITVIAPGTHAATGKTTPVDADELPIVDSAASNVLKKLTWANLKATAKTYFDTLYQPLAAALTSIAGLTPSNDDVLQRKSGAWTNRTMAQLIADLGALATTFQPLDSDLTTIAGLTATSDNFMQSKSSAWASRTPTQVTADLIAFVGDSGSGGTKGLVPAPATGDATKALFGDGTFKTIPGGGDALTSNPLSQFAATTSLQLKGVMSDETGSGALVFATSPALVTPDLGTPSAGTLTNATGLPVAGIANSTSTVLGVGGLNVGHASDTTLDRASAGVLQVEGNRIFAVGGADVPVADGGTGSSTAAGAATNLGLGTGDSPQFTGVNVGHATDTTITRSGAGDIAVEGNGVYRAGGTDVPVADGGTGASTLTGILLGSGTSAITGLDAGVLSAIRVYTADDTWAKPSGLRFIVVELRGGGGGGGGVGTASGLGTSPGGGQGEYALKKIAASALASTETVDVGAGGAGGVGDSTIASANGSQSAFGTTPIVTASGGSGGQGSTGTSTSRVGGVGGTGGTGGDIHIKGGLGQGANSGAAGGGGGEGGGAGQNGNGAGNAGVRGGGGGGAQDNGTTQRTGGAGGAGWIIVREYL